MIRFIECKKSGYPYRTKQNILNSDVTIAFAHDFSSAGEKLTKRLCEENGKLYIPWEINTSKILDLTEIQRVAERINVWNDDSVDINIAGNGIYTLCKIGYTQEMIDWGIYIFLYNLNQLTNIAGVCSGGQTGCDESGAKAADKLGISTMVRAPYGWMFRDINGKDILNEELFKARFV